MDFPDSSEVACLAAVMHHEARGESLAGQRAVANVAMNRAKENTSSVCYEIKRPYQFSFMNKKRRIPRADEMFVKMAREILLLDMYGYHKDNTHGSTFFFRHDLDTTLKTRLKYVKRIGQHVFYKEKR